VSASTPRGFATVLTCLTLVIVTPVGAAGPEDVGTLEARLGEAPHDTDAHYALARAYFASGRFDESADEFDRLLALDPRNADWLLGRAQAALALGSASDAVTLLERARALAPDYEDVWLGEAIALERAGRHAAAEELLEAAGSRFPAAQWPASRRRRLRESRLGASGMRVGASAAYEELSGAHDSWRSGTLHLERAFGSASRLALGASVEQRHGEQDEQVSIGFVRRLAGGWVIQTSGEAVHDAQLLPETQLQVEVGRPLGRSLSASLRYRHAAYTNVDVDALSATTEYAFNRYRVGYTLTATRPTAIETRFAHALRLARDYGEGSTFALSLARGEDAETVAPGQVLVTRNTSVVLYGTHWRSAAWGMTWSCGWVEQGDLYERLGVRFGFEHRF
jgi:YaiO family outer membrane protein